MIPRKTDLRQKRNRQFYTPAVGCDFPMGVIQGNQSHVRHSKLCQVVHRPSVGTRIQAPDHPKRPRIGLSHFCLARSAPRLSLGNRRAPTCRRQSGTTYPRATLCMTSAQTWGMSPCHSPSTLDPQGRSSPSSRFRGMLKPFAKTSGSTDSPTFNCWSSPRRTGRHRKFGLASKQSLRYRISHQDRIDRRTHGDGRAGLPKVRQNRC